MKMIFFPLLLLAGCIVVPEQPQDQEPATVYITSEPPPPTLRDQWKEMRKESEVKEISEPTASSKFFKMMEAPATSAAKRVTKTKTKTKTKATSSKKDDKPQAQAQTPAPAPAQDKAGSVPKPAAASEPPKKAGP